MKILVINGDCVQTNSSANLCHLAYIRGMVAAGHDVYLLSADGRDYELDKNMSIPSEVKCFTIYGTSLYQKISLRKIRNNDEKKLVTQPENAANQGTSGLKRRLKDGILRMYGPHGIYKTFVRKAKKFRSEENFDFVISLSTPPSSHLLAYYLIHSKHVSTKHWIQIWEDPWYGDAYGFNGSKKIKQEEQRLLSFAERICYVSPLTLRRQQKQYPESASKMYWQPLPSYYTSNTPLKPMAGRKYGYFGDYAPAARNLKPFYTSALKCGLELHICGTPHTLFQPTEHIKISPRMPLEELRPIEDDTNVLVFLSNLRGGQIPGKIYQYAATYKTVLFILDGTAEEQDVLRSFFGQFHRFVFCENTVESITDAIGRIERGELGDVVNRPLDDFAPERIIQKILEG